MKIKESSSRRAARHSPTGYSAWKLLAKRTLRPQLALSLAVSSLTFFISFSALGQTIQEPKQPCLMTCLLGGADPQQTRAIDPEYRKFDDLVSFLRSRNQKQFAIPTPRGIDEGQYVSIGGIEEWITIRGYDRSNPVLLFVHGGPGDVTNPWTFAMFAAWEKQFTVVQWDERGSGRSLRKSGPGVAPTLTVERMVQDGVELTEYLRKHLGKDRIIIVCHSFGSILGLGMVRARPELFFAYVGTGQVADESRNYSVAYDGLLRKARAERNQEAMDDLIRVGAPPYTSGEGFGVQRKWSNRFEGADQFLPGTLGLSLVSPGYSVGDINDAADGQVLSADRLVPQTALMGPKELGLRFAIPCSFSRVLKTSRHQRHSLGNTNYR